MGPVVVVPVQPVAEHRVAGGLAGVGLVVGPFLGQGAVEAFHLAVGLRPPRAGVVRADAQPGAGGAPGGLGVGPGVVGQHPLHGHPVGGEPGHRAGEEACAGAGFLIGEDLGVGQPGVIVEGGVDEGVAVPVTVLAALGPAQHPVPAAVGDSGELLHVHVHQLPGCAAFVAADRLAGGPVAAVQAGQPPAHQHPVHRGGRHADPGGDPDRADLVRPPQHHDPLLHLGWDALRAVMGGWAG